MGQEFAQYKEWNFETHLDWHILEYDEHAEMHNYVKELNQFYLDSKELWENESDWSGFKWIVPDDNMNSVIVFRRLARAVEDDFEGADELIVVANFLPKEHEEYTFGVPYAGDYKEVFSTDNKKFGGEGLLNGTLTAIDAPDLMHGENYALTVKIPPMSAFFLKPLKNGKNHKNGIKITGTTTKNNQENVK